MFTCYQQRQPCRPFPVINWSSKNFNSRSSYTTFYYYHNNRLSPHKTSQNWILLHHKLWWKTIAHPGSLGQRGYQFILFIDTASVRLCTTVQHLCHFIHIWVAVPLSLVRVKPFRAELFKTIPFRTCWGYQLSSDLLGEYAKEDGVCESLSIETNTLSQCVCVCVCVHVCVCEFSITEFLLPIN